MIVFLLFIIAMALVFGPTAAAIAGGLLIAFFVFLVLIDSLTPQRNPLDSLTPQPSPLDYEQYRKELLQQLERDRTERRERELSEAREIELWEEQRRIASEARKKRIREWFRFR